MGGPLPSEPSGLPSFAMMRANAWMSGDTSATPGTLRTLSTVSSGMRVRSCRPNSPSTTSVERTYPSMFLNTSWKRLSNVRFSVAENTEVPLRKAVPRMTAMEVMNSLALRPRIPFRMTRRNTGQFPRFFIRSSTRSGVGSRISSTTWPSARKTMRSA